MNFGSDTYIEGLTLFELEAASEINALEVKAARPEAEASDIRWEQAEKGRLLLGAGDHAGTDGFDVEAGGWDHLSRVVSLL